jgi:hypothetical protein
MRTYKIDHYPPYIALSYTWGDPNDTVPVLCDGRVIDVTRNFKEALWQFREDRKRLVRQSVPTVSHYKLLHFWVDAVCINQANDKEKSFQVSLMTEIYKRARHVFAWLGPADKSSDSAIRCIDNIGVMAAASGIKDLFEACHKIWHDMFFAPRGIQRLVSVDPVVRNIDGSLSTVSGKALKELFDVLFRLEQSA